MANTDRANGFRKTTGGNLDALNTVYATLALACEAIPNVLDGDGVNLRFGKVVQIGTVTNFVEHHWFGGFSDSNLVPKLKDYLKERDGLRKTEILNATIYSDELSGGFPNTGRYGDPSSVIIPDSGFVYSSNIIPAQTGQILEISGIPITISSASTVVGYLYDANGSQLMSVQKALLVPMSNGRYRYTVPAPPSGGTIAGWGVVLRVQDGATATVRRLMQEGSGKIHGSLIPDDLTTYVKPAQIADKITLADIMDITKYGQEASGGFTNTGTYANPITTINANTGFVRSDNVIPIAPGEIWAFSGISVTVASASTTIGYLYDASGNQVKSILKSALVDVGGGVYRYTIPSTGSGEALVTKMGVNLRIGDRATAKVNKLIQSGTDKIFRDLIPDTTLPPVLFTWNLTSFNPNRSTYTSGVERMIVFTKYPGTSDYYVGHTIGREISTVEFCDYFRLTWAYLYRYIDGVMVAQNLQVLATGENEFVFKEIGKSDFTGGYHGDEKTDYAGMGIKFLADGVMLTPSDLAADFSLRPCQKFEYYELSNMYRTDDPSHAIVAKHIKKTTFQEGGYITYNTIVPSMSITAERVYHGIVCITNNLASYAINDMLVQRTMLGTGTSEDHYIPVVGGHQISYTQPTRKLGAIVTSRLINNEVLDRQSIADTKDNERYAKYYRGLENIGLTNGFIYEGETSVIYTKL
jgi:hypothetical protein